MKYCNTLIAVKDMSASLKFYTELFGLEVAADFGWCKALTCGLTLQEHFDEIARFPQETMKFRSNTMELYFETEDFDGFIALLEAYPQVERLHEAETFPWLQRGIRIYDPDGHLIEVSESMYTVACREFEKGAEVEETARRIRHPLEVVQTWHEQYQASRNAFQDQEFSVCGADCAACYCYGKMCRGCNACGGRVFHAPEGKACPIYECVVNHKGLKDCGRCGEVPCHIWKDTRDPKYTDEEFAENVRGRVEALKKKNLM